MASIMELCRNYTLLSEEEAQTIIEMDAQLQLIADVSEAVELIARLKPDLAIMDIKMSVMNGIKASQIIRKLQQDTSILLLTAYSQKELVKDAREAGVTAFLVKPISEEDLLPAVEIAYSLTEEEAYKKMRKASIIARMPLSKLAACILTDGVELLSDVVQDG